MPYPIILPFPCLLGEGAGGGGLSVAPNWYTLIIFVGYLVFTTLLGLWQTRRIKSSRDYAVTKMPVWQAAAFLSGFTLGGGSTYGIAGDSVKFGLTYLIWFPFSVALSEAVYAAFVGAANAQRATYLQQHSPRAPLHTSENRSGSGWRETISRAIALCRAICSARSSVSISPLRTTTRPLITEKSTRST